MKQIFLTAVIFLSVFLFAIPLNAQWSNAGSVDNTDPLYKEITFQGRVNRTAALTSNSFDFINFSNVYDFYKYLDASDDSVKITIVLRGSEYSGKWTTIDTLYNSSTSELQTALTDTIPTTTFTNYDLTVKGISGNGDSTYFYGTLKFRKK